MNRVHSEVYFSVNKTYVKYLSGAPTSRVRIEHVTLQSLLLSSFVSSFYIALISLLIYFTHYFR